MKILFCGSFYTPAILSAMQSKHAIGFANDLLQKSYLKGLSMNHQDVYACTLPNVASCLSEGDIYQKQEYANLYGIHSCSLPFFNIPVLKHYFKYKTLIHKIQSDKRDYDLFLAYDLDVALLAAARFVKKRYPTWKVVFIIPDLPGFTGATSKLVNILTLLTEWISKRCYNSVDGFVYLSKYMKDYLKLTQNSVVIEGIYNDDTLLEYDAKSNIGDANSKVIMYAGAMSERNGVLMLIEAFEYMNSPNSQLILCGDGPLRDKILSMAKIDSRIKFMGNVAHEQVLEYYRFADLLVNPRPPKEDFTRYSFPSKTMEYFASATPVMMYRLSGVPEEYYKHCVIFTADTFIEMANQIQDFFSINRDVRIEIGRKAREFIMKNKRPYNQVKIMLDFVDSI